ncbi:MAG: aminoacetone oxidase family FAD-binding enzyme [Gemmatimonadaceae bacterium]
MPRVIVIGAGAAGTMAAIFAAKGGAETILLERTRDGGRKILISGGGRCNVLPMKLDESRFITDSSPNTLRKMLRSWPLSEQIAFFENDLSIPLVEEEESSKLFPASHKARDVRDGLLQHADDQGVHILMNTLVTNVTQHNGRWRVELDGQAPLDCDAVIIATGGLSVPNTGSDGFGLKLLETMGHTIHPTYAALTPITGNSPAFSSLSGVSMPITITAKSDERASTAYGGFLFTHHGYSGPSVLDVSHVVVRARRENSDSAKLRVQWTSLTDKDWELALQPKGARTVTGALRAEMPDRLAAVLLEQVNINPQTGLGELRREQRLKLIDTLVRGELPWTGDEGYKKAEVTGGGVSLAEVDARTMESKKHVGLFLCGEVLDAFGPIGGYNFTWAWATGRAAGIGAAAKSAT